MRMERMLKPQEVAERLNVSVRTVRIWLWKGVLKGVKIGRVWRVREKDLEDFIKKAEKGR